MKKVIVLCTGNSCRSQMAQGFLNYFTGNRHSIYSAGICPHDIHPLAIKAMSELGIDISFHTSNDIKEYLDIDFDYIITVCDHAEERCPIFPNATAKRIHQNFQDPSKMDGNDDQINQAFESCRDKISEFCLAFCKKHLSN
ncbi:MAG: arsenate reductase ArsC [Flavobacteriaceae bacterium]|nr:arsenate reductase ArsC [Flavobacteriaceae bacterium]MCY4267483.1 arsenate reductase ArsC [Flavobacteriaceae bacterium]